MEKERETCPASDVKTVTTTNTTPDLFSQGFLSSPLDENQNLEDDFRSMYDSIFPPKSSITPSANEQHRLNRARLILEYQQLCDHYDLCFSRLQAVSSEVEALRQENSDLRLANTKLLKLLNNSFHSLNDDISSGFSPKSVMEPSQFEKENVRETVVERDSLPKSISVRSAGYLKANPTKARIGPSRQLVQRVHVPAAGREEQKALEFEVYNQGMWKTELCNKWQETGTCPYGDQCQFAHGITELRPVIRHPRYKTEICRMVLAGDTCPYGHRCHFRHSLTEQERLMLPRWSTYTPNHNRR